MREHGFTPSLKSVKSDQLQATYLWFPRPCHGALLRCLFIRWQDSAFRMNWVRVATNRGAR
ncbi:hypothetical protein GCM10009664_43310 [Kitasatospora gansuensis]